MKTHLTALTLLSLIAPMLLHAATIGISPERVWLSKENFFSGETVNVSTVVVNSATKTLRGTVEFLDGTTVIGTKEFTIKEGNSEILSITWVASYGTKSISARIVNPILGDSSFSLGGSQSSGKVSQFIDLDTDGDRVGNKIDTDDDNDGLTDIDELKKKTDPLVKDTDQDGAIDSMDAHPLTPDQPIPVTKQVNTKEPLVSTTTIDLAIVPDEIEPVAERSLGKSEGFRLAQKEKIDTQVTLLVNEAKGTTTPFNNVEREGWREMVRSVESGDLIKTPFTYVKLFFSLCYQLFVSHAWLYYSALALIVFSLLRILRSMIFG